MHPYLVSHYGVDVEMKLKHILNPLEHFAVVIHDGKDLYIMQSEIALSKYGEEHAIIEGNEIYIDTRRT